MCYETQLEQICLVPPLRAYHCTIYLQYNLLEFIGHSHTVPIQPHFSFLYLLIAVVHTHCTDTHHQERSTHSPTAAVQSLFCKVSWG